MSDPTRSNIMQRVYDALPPPESPIEKMLTVDQISTVLHFDPETIRTALKRLGRLRCVRSTCVDSDWLYSLRRGAKRPADSRGRRKR